MSKEIFDTLRGMIAQGALEDALEQLDSVLSSQGNTAFSQTAQYREFRREVGTHLGVLRSNRRQSRLGLGDAAQGQQQLARASAATLELLDDIERAMGRARALLPAAQPRAAALPATETVAGSLEKIWGRNNLKSLAWLHQGIRCAKAVCRIVTPEGFGTGFMLGNGWLMTNNHVLASAGDAGRSTAEFNYEEDSGGRLLPVAAYQLEAESFVTDVALDCSVVRVSLKPGDRPLSDWGALALAKDSAIELGEHVTVIQHPSGGVKQICLTANQVVNTYGAYVHYMTDTMPGSSGSPVFDDKWRVVALHHAGGELQRNAAGERIYANEGVLIRDIAKHPKLSAALGA
jgi:V8-like Glu-specific endopeptidase